MSLSAPAFFRLRRYQGIQPAQSLSAFLLQYLGGPGLCLAVAFVVLQPLHGDFWWADHIYAWGHHAWAWKDRVLTESILHRGGRNVSTLAWVLLACLTLLSSVRAAWTPWRRPLLYLLLATAATTLLVGALKRFTDMDCPWDLLRYGGTREYVGLWQMRPLGMSRAACFPAGHASAGYGWVALYFFFRATLPQWRGYGLGIGLGLGLLFGMAQQWRGAHFLSHDLATLAIAWAISTVLYRAMRLPDRVLAAEPAAALSLPALAEAQP